MANIYYVRDDGEAPSSLTPFTAFETGTMTALGVANFYESIALAQAADTTPVSGDFILYSDIHAFSSSSSIELGITGVTYFCVSDIAIDASRRDGNRGEEFATGGAADVRFRNGNYNGLAVRGDDNIILNNSNFMRDCTFSISGSSDSFSLSGDNTGNTLINCEFIFNHTNQVMAFNAGSYLNMIGGAISSTAGGQPALIASLASNGGFTCKFVGVDMAGITGTLFSNVGIDPVNDDTMQITMDMCKLADGVAFTNEDFKHVAHRLLATRCSFTSASAEYQYHLHAFGGDVDDDDTIFRNEDEAFTESNQKISYKIVTNSDASLGSPLWIDYPINRYSKLSAGATDTLRFYITSNTALTNKDIYVSVYYPDGTNKQTTNCEISAPATFGDTLDLMATGTTLTTDSTSTWTGGLSNKYQIDVDTSGDVGSDTYPIIKVYVTKPSITIQMASEFDLV